MVFSRDRIVCVSFSLVVCVSAESALRGRSPPKTRSVCRLLGLSTVGRGGLTVRIPFSGLIEKSSLFRKGGTN